MATTVNQVIAKFKAYYANYTVLLWEVSSTHNSIYVEYTDENNMTRRCDINNRTGMIILMVRRITLSTPLPPTDTEEYTPRLTDAHWLEQLVETQTATTNRKTKLEEDNND